MARKNTPIQHGDYFNTAAAAEYLGLSVAAINYHVSVSGLLKPDGDNPRQNWYTKAQLDAFKAALRPAGRPRIHAADKPKPRELAKAE